MLPHIETPATRAEFDKFALAGKELMDLHINYEDAEPWPLTFKVTGDENDRETWRVIKLAWAKKKDPETGKNINDVTTVQKYVARMLTLSEKQLSAADVTGDGNVDISDATAVQRYLAGIITEF